MKVSLRSYILLAFTFACVSVATFATDTQAFTVPPNDGYVTDDAGVLSAAEDEILEEELRLFKQDTNNSIVVGIVRSLETTPIEDATLALRNAWSVASLEGQQNIVILIGYEERQMVVDPDDVLADILTQEVIDGIVSEEMMPAFRDGKYAQSISLGIGAIKKHLGGEFAADRYDNADDKGMPWVALWKAFLLMILAAAAADTISTVLRPKTAAWFGGLMGVLTGLVLAFRYGLWLAIPVFVILGLVCDAIVRSQILSRLQTKRAGTRNRRKRRSPVADEGGYEE